MFSPERAFVRAIFFSGFTLTLAADDCKIIESSFLHRENWGASNERGAVTGAA